MLRAWNDLNRARVPNGSWGGPSNGRACRYPVFHIQPRVLAWRAFRVAFT